VDVPKVEFLVSYHRQAVLGLQLFELGLIHVLIFIAIIFVCDLVEKLAIPDFTLFAFEKEFAEFCGCKKRLDFGAV